MRSPLPGDDPPAKIHQIRVLIDGALALARDLDRALVYDLALDHALASDRARDLDRPLALASEEARSLARDLDDVVAHDVALDLASGLARARDLTILATQFRGELQELVAVVTDARARMMALRTAVSETKGAGLSRNRAYVAMSRTAARVAAWSVRVLPPAYRARYDEEFQNELHELAAIGATRRDQIWHAVRLLTHAVKLRSELNGATRSQRAVS